ncbi:MAG TPA: hypothetical protein H9755_11765 [Candidatus Dietzia intestinigallinarum]|nr:hypothetical protein [Candidatus Dietzia intestinigallinarum]
MNKTRTGSFAAALALTAVTVAAAPAHAAPAADTAAPAVETGTVHYATTDAGSSAAGSLENEFVQVGLVLVAGLGVSAALAIGAGIAGGAIELPQIPGLPL